MAVTLEGLGIDKLSVEERLELIDLIWDSLPEQVPAGDIPEWHKELLTRRMKEAETNPDAVRPWREVLKELGQE